MLFNGNTDHDYLMRLVALLKVSGIPFCLYSNDKVNASNLLDCVVTRALFKYNFDLVNDDKLKIDIVSIKELYGRILTNQ